MSESRVLVKRILRSLLAETREEDPQAQENWFATNVPGLRFPNPFGTLLTHLQEHHKLCLGPPRAQILAEHLERLGERELVLVLHEIAVLVPEWRSNYRRLLDEYDLLDRGERLRGLQDRVAQIAEDGLIEGKQTLRGVDAAVQQLVYGAMELQRVGVGRRHTLDNEAAEPRLKEVYHRKHEAGSTVHGATSLGPLDRATRGGHAGEVWVIGGYAKHGKTTFALNWARHLAVEGAWNVYYVTLEMPPEDIWEVLYASHSCHPKWGRHPLLHEEISAGRFADPRDEAHYLGRIQPDWTSGEFGNIVVEQPPGVATVDSIWGAAEALHRSRPEAALDMIVIDHLLLLSPSPGMERAGKREVVTENVIRTKRMSLEFDRGQGILVVLPYQLSRSGYEEAKLNGGIYATTAFAETAEIERSIDVGVTVYRDDAMARLNEIQVCHLLHRKGKLADPFRAYAPFQYRYMADLQVDHARANLGAR